ncbi:hypothetical protein DFA_02041 [Cavenderia fasciculata]|uniref:Uncharacterized protein n=1 Tax=Cavenderia fasciculata TaxID=261658 RepID=F4PYI9_CACFS|nr:uncharacterized protein DFA_02041 [Cavenderia fasciculata]EGG19255.1 hypothetical protein DFA_02041 [Cavenderia fasciculata]|eukprot:XP_004357526.1 hypothetical protein DFA_02041 [Cavenderia fasciculata]
MTFKIKAKKMGIETLGKVNRFTKVARKHGQKLYYIDLGGAPILEEPPTHRSKVGILWSLVVLFIMAFFIILTISQFSKGKSQPNILSSVPSIIYTSEVPSSYLPFSSPPVGILFKDASGKDILNSSLLEVHYKYITIFNQDALPRIRRSIASVECSFDGINTVSGGSSNNISKLTTKAICPNESVELVGTFELPVYSYLEVEVNRCECPTNTSIPCTCATDQEFNDIFWTGSLNLIIMETIPSYSVIARKVDIFPKDPDLSKPPSQVNNTRSLYWKNVLAFMNRVDVYIRRKTIFNGPRYIFDYHFSEFFAVGTIMARPEDFTPGDPLLFKGYIRMDITDSQEMRQSPQLLQLIGSWGALWSFLLAHCRLLDPTLQQKGVLSKRPY